MPSRDCGPGIDDGSLPRGGGLGSPPSFRLGTVGLRRSGAAVVAIPASRRRCLRGWHLAPRRRAAASNRCHEGRASEAPGAARLAATALQQQQRQQQQQQGSAARRALWCGLELVAERRKPGATRHRLPKRFQADRRSGGARRRLRATPHGTRAHSAALASRVACGIAARERGESFRRFAAARFGRMRRDAPAGRRAGLLLQPMRRRARAEGVALAPVSVCAPAPAAGR